MSVINAIPMLLGGEGYEISRSVRIRLSASAYFNRTFSTPTNNSRFTWSGWIKRGILAGNGQCFFGAGNNSNTVFAFAGTTATDNLDFYSYNGGTTFRLTTTAVYRDPSAWYHVVFVCDTGNATSGDRAQIWVNGVRVTSFTTATYPSQNASVLFNDPAQSQTIGLVKTVTYNTYMDGYITEVNFIDGQALTPSSFGETDSITGVWKPKKYAGTYGTNGFYLNFSDNSSNTATTIGKDNSGNGNNWTPNNISVTAGVTYDSMLDVPTMWADGGNGRGNYCVINPLDKGSSGTISDGNLATSSQTASANGTFGLTTGKWYFEASFSSITGASSLVEVGIQATNIQGYLSSGNKDLDTTQTAYGATYTTSDIIGCAFDLDAKQMTFYKNGTSQGTFTYTVADTYFPMIRARGTTTFAGTINFGQRPFAYTPPTGFKALNTQNLPESTIKAGNQYFDATLYTGNGTAVTVTNSGGFAPDLVWTKARGSTTGNHSIGDTVRGTGKVLCSDLTNVEISDAQTYTSFNSNGFSYGNEVSGNRSGNTMVSWQWKESASAGFDIVTQTLGTTGINTLSHSLGVAPKMILAKRRDAVEQWLVYHASGTTQSQYLGLNTTAAVATSANLWGSSAFSSSQFYFSGTSGTQYLFYLFAEVAGFSKFGSYTGNGSDDGPFVYCGFRPRYVLIKRTDASDNWFIHDTSRNPSNIVNLQLKAQSSDAEASTVFDIVSNGFKVRNSFSGYNVSGGTYIFMALAENPFKNSLAR